MGSHNNMRERERVGLERKREGADRKKEGEDINIEIGGGAHARAMEMLLSIM